MRNLRARYVFLVALLATGTTKSALPAELVLVNTSGVTLSQLYIAPCGNRTWGRNQLAGVSVWSSKSYTISDIAPGCYDLKVVIPPWNDCMVTGVAMRSAMLWTITWSTVEQSNFGDCSTTPHIASVGSRPLLEGEHHW